MIPIYASVVGVTAQGIPNLYPENVSLDNRVLV